MPFPSHPLYADPSIWQFQQQQQQLILYGGGNEISSSNNTLPHPPLLQPPAAIGGSMNIRPGSMTDKARITKVPLPDTALKCPRCESTNTKFCYFNNYNLTQPRHFCKTCRRYWTRGGALRNVPVGGGCRRVSTKRSSKKRSKYPAVSRIATGTTTTYSTVQTLGDHNGINMIDGVQLPFYPQSMNQMEHELGDHYNIGAGNYGGALIDPHIAMLYQSGGMSLTDHAMDQQWNGLPESETAQTQLHLPPFPFLTNLKQQEDSSQSSGLLYQFDQFGGHLSLSGSNLDSLGKDSNRNAVSMASLLDQTVATNFTNVKMEDRNKGFMGLPEMQTQTAASHKQSIQHP